MASTIQVFGTRKCRDTNKALRFFKERGIKFQFIDLNEKGLSKGELESIARNVPLEELLDKNGRQYKIRSMKYMAFNLENELLNDPLLLKTPIVRLGTEAVVGYQPERWKKFTFKS